MTNFKKIYQTRAAEYDQLVSYEDYEGNILEALTEIRPLVGTKVIELGAGTGRLTRLLAPWVRHITFFDISFHMLSVAKQKLTLAGSLNSAWAIADNRCLPARSGTADISIAGWTLGHFTGWHPNRWRTEIGLALTEMRRVLRPGGTIIILETQGTGRVTPKPPSPDLTAFYHWLEREHGFASTWVRTDYRFDSPAQAKALITFFFGDELATRVIHAGTTIVPECTGIWWLTI